jgi:hypothetical protein
MKQRNLNAIPDYPLIDILIEDLDDIGEWLEGSFKIHFENEIKGSFTIRQLVEVIKQKIKTIASDNSCTTQMAFYIFRNLMVKSFNLKRTEIKPDSKLAEIITAGKRKVLWQIIRNKLYWHISPLQPPLWLTGIFLIILASSILFLFKPIMCLMVPISLTGFIISGKLGNELPYKTVGDLCIDATNRNYKQIRIARTDSVNEKEITDIVINYFSWMNSKKGKVGLDTLVNFN